MNKLKENKYYQIYQAIGFERKGLFQLIKNEFNPLTVLYPGCLIHITPSFYFEHVVYIDKSQLSNDFFNDTELVSSILSQNKVLTKPTYWKFINKDFSSDLGLREQSYDLLLSIFSGQMIQYCQKYIKPGGLILTTSLFSDNETTQNNSNFKLIAMIKCKNGKYSIDTDLKTSKPNDSKMKKSNNGFMYVDNETYFVYRKIL